MGAIQYFGKKTNDKTYINVAEHSSVFQRQSSSEVMLVRLRSVNRTTKPNQKTCMQDTGGGVVDYGKHQSVREHVVIGVLVVKEFQTASWLTDRTY